MENHRILPTTLIKLNIGKLKRPSTGYRKPSMKRQRGLCLLNSKTVSDLNFQSPSVMSRDNCYMAATTPASAVTIDSTTMIGKPSASWSKLGSGSFASKVNRLTPGLFEPLPFFVQSSLVKDPVKSREVSTKKPVLESSVFKSVCK